MASNPGGTRLSTRTDYRTIFVTGEPGVGKTTLLLRLEKYLREKGVFPAGIITQEVRQGGERVGFRIRDILSGKEGWLAKKAGASALRVGKYFVVTRDLEEVGANAIEAATESGEVVLVDEVGPMEMTNERFRRALSGLLSSRKIVIATVKYGSHYEEVERVSEASGILKVVLTSKNRETSLGQITSTLEGWLGK